MKKISVKIISIVIALITVLSPALICSASSTRAFENYIKTIEFKNKYGIGSFCEVTMDDETKEICRIISEKSSFDIELIINSLPKIQPVSRFISGILGINFPSLHKKIYDSAISCYNDRNDAAGIFLQLLSMYIGVVDRLDIVLEPLTGSVSQFVIYIQYLDGIYERYVPSVYYNTVTGDFYGRDEKGFAALGYDFNINDMVVSAPNNCWMRDTGFCVEYDILANGLGMFDYDTRRFYFDYGDKEWLIQMWKGNYVVSNGSEIGTYNRDKSKIGTYYDVVTDEERLNVSMSLYHSGDLLFSTEKKPTWWANGFQLSDELYEAEELTLCGEITFENEEMLQAFVNAVQNEKHNDVKFSVNGLTVSVEW